MNETQQTAYRIPQRSVKKQTRYGFIVLGGLFFLSLYFMELIYRLFYGEVFFNSDIFVIMLFILPISTFFAFLSSSFRTSKANRTVGMILLLFCWFWFSVQSVYATVFRTVLLLDSFQMAGMVFDSFWKDAIIGTLKTVPQIILYFIPVAVLIFLNKKGVQVFPARMKKVVRNRLIVGVIAFILISEIYTLIPGKGLVSTRELYRGSFEPIQTTRKFGMLTTLRLDATQMVFGLEDMDKFPGKLFAKKETEHKESSITIFDILKAADIDPVTKKTEAADKIEEVLDPVEYDPNVMNINFEQLIADCKDQELLKAHTWFSQREATKQNKFTGVFEGYNVITITAEGFWKYAVSEKYTPTLYKLANEGFVFENYYCPLGSHSTCDGEFAATTGLLPSNQYNAFYETIGNSMYFTLGNQLSAVGYPTTAYHDHYASYYKRNETHPNMGYDFYGVGSKQLDIPVVWPESDLAMMDYVIPNHLGEGAEYPFHLYFMTVSGHMNYNFGGNSMSAKHKDDVADLDMSEEARAYIACNMELDQAMESLLRQLEEAGQLEKTLIVLAGDHYPYGMQESTWEEFMGFKPTPFDLAKSTLIMWSPVITKPYKVDKVCFNSDILPTVSNLLGLEYDSRLLMGRDIFSDCDGLAVFHNKSFICEYGIFDSSSNEFTPFEGKTAPPGYVEETFQYVKDLFTMNNTILKKDYYRKIGLVH